MDLVGQMPLLETENKTVLGFLLVYSMRFPFYLFHAIKSSYPSCGVPLVSNDAAEYTTRFDDSLFSATYQSLEFRFFLIFLYCQENKFPLVVVTI